MSRLAGEDEGWEYADADTQSHVHGIHPYPARMIPQIANRLIRSKSKPGDTVLDPFCGSGGVLTEALLLGRNGVGVDINPLACILAKVKTTPLNFEKLKKKAETLLNAVEQNVLALRAGNLNVEPFYFRNAYHWFRENVVRELTVVRDCVDQLVDQKRDEDIYRFFQVCLSMTVRKTSNIRVGDNPYFIRAMVDRELQRYHPDVLATFREQVSSSMKRVKEFSALCPKGVKADIRLADTRWLPLPDESVDLIVTSPPYGEESHTMSYTRFSKLSLFWLGHGISRQNRFARKTLGGGLVLPRPYSELLDRLCKKIAERDRQRSKEVFSFFWDYSRCLFQMRRVLKPGGHCCIVIGDRSARGIPISNGGMTATLAEKIGFRLAEAHQRKIPVKVLPRRDYKVELINRENILILKKDSFSPC